MHCVCEAAFDGLDVRFLRAVPLCDLRVADPGGEAAEHAAIGWGAVLVTPVLRSAHLVEAVHDGAVGDVGCGKADSVTVLYLLTEWDFAHGVAPYHLNAAVSSGRMYGNPCRGSDKPA